MNHYEDTFASDAEADAAQELTIAMNFLVCVKEVPETDAPLEIDVTSLRPASRDANYYRMNRYDECAVEEALLIKESLPDVSVDALTVGPPEAERVVRRAVGMGADRGAHIVREVDRFESPFTIASFIAQFARGRRYDLIMTGVIAEDDMQGQVGPLIAEMLAVPCVTSTVLTEIRTDTGHVYVEREIEQGMRETFLVTLPCVLTIQSGINRPRYPSLSNTLRAKRTPPERIDAATLETPPPRDRITALRAPSKTRTGLILEGTTEEKAAKLADMIIEKGLA